MTPEREQPLYPRIAVVATAVATTVVALSARLAWLTTRADSAQAAAVSTYAIEAPRGSIWDRDGDLLAVETYAYDIGVDLPTLGGYDAAALAAVAGPVLGRPAADIEAAIAEGRADVRRRWISLARGVGADTLDALRRARVPVGDDTVSLQAMGLTTERLPRRSYPLGADAAHVMGFLNLDGEAHYGIEGRYDAELTGRAGTLAGYEGTDPRAFRPSRPGADLRLTIDRDIQVAASRALRDVVEDQSASGGTVVVLEARTGAVLAMASWPAYDPNQYAQANPDAFLDPAISKIYEPGSVVKAVTVASALDVGAVSADTQYHDTGTIEIDGVTIANWDHLAHGMTSLTEMLEHSLNVGAVHVAQALGGPRFYPALAAFGFGSPTGVDLEGEVAGIVRWPDRDPGWAPVYLATNSFGQGMSATPLQMAAAIGAIANDGVLMTPYVVAEILPPDGAPVPVAPRARHQVIGPETARTVRGMLLAVVDNHVTQAAIPGHAIAGKTGTSQIPTDGGYEEHATIASFCGFFPAADPRVVILAKVDRPEAVRGSEVAAPLFRAVAAAVIDALDLPPDRPVAEAAR